MTNRSHGSKLPLFKSTRSDTAEVVSNLNELLHRAHRACSQSQHFTHNHFNMCIRSAVLRHSGTSPPGHRNHRNT